MIKPSAIHLGGEVTHHFRRGGNLHHRFALGAQGHHKSRGLNGGCFTIHNTSHDSEHLLTCQVIAGQEGIKGVFRGHALGLSDFKVVGHDSRFTQHNAGGTVLLGRQINGTFHQFGLQGVAGNNEVEVDFSEHLGVGFSALGVDFHHAIRHLCP